MLTSETLTSMGAPGAPATVGVASVRQIQTHSKTYISDSLCEIQAKVSKSNYEITSIEV